MKRLKNCQSTKNDILIHNRQRVTSEPQTLESCVQERAHHRPTHRNESARQFFIMIHSIHLRRWGYAIKVNKTDNTNCACRLKGWQLSNELLLIFLLDLCCFVRLAYDFSSLKCCFRMISFVYFQIHLIIFTKAFMSRDSYTQTPNIDRSHG